MTIINVVFVGSLLIRPRKVEAALLLLLPLPAAVEGHQVLEAGKPPLLVNIISATFAVNAKVLHCPCSCSATTVTDNGQSIFLWHSRSVDNKATDGAVDELLQ